ncbi:FecCD family ABC transporter permease [Butyrivibrio sp. AE2032]|uniref:FecCD family ABC transporter permease n=1 Tax=Butyrivibrio sp. AE2032 TaxID=1458463 RepID=UPI000555E54D|nr:iron ABC transporter permease [Butyrivibrio sp. AE2032]
MTKRGTGLKIAISAVLCLFILILAIRSGSVYISLKDLFGIIGGHITGKGTPSDIEPMMDSIFWTIRMPRALMAFMVGGALSVSGACMQALLQNPLASSYTLGVSSGASLGAAMVLILEISIPALAGFMLPFAGFVFGLATVVAAMLLASAIDRSISNTTVVLIGMVLSLFVNGMMNLLSTLYSDHSKQLILWMMGSFSARGWKHCAIMFPVCVAGFIVLMLMSRKLDIMSFGDLQARAMGVDAKKTKTAAILVCSLLTGVSVAFTGVIGFVDLAAPHIVRKIFGPSHRLVLPLSFIYGGAFMAACDLISRTLLSPREIPVGAVTALIGAPFFAYVFFASRRKR